MTDTDGFNDVESAINKISPEEEVDFDHIIETLNEAENEIVYNATMNHRPSYAEPSIWRRGALVVSVEGETVQVGGQTVMGIGLLGYLVTIENTSFPNTLRIRFSTLTEKNESILTSEHGNIERVIESPLSISGTDAINPYGFIVDRKNGLRILEDGDLILVSRTGIFAGMNGWELARKMEEKWRDAEYKADEIQEAYERIVAEFDRKEREVTELKLEIADLQEKEIEWQNRIVKAEAIMEDLKRILLSYKNKIPTLAEENETLMNENYRLISDVIGTIKKLEATVLKMESIHLAYTMESSIPEELMETTKELERDRLEDIGLIKERESDEERIEGSSEDKHEPEGFGGYSSGGQASEGENKEGQGIGGSFIPAEKKDGKIINAFKKIAGKGKKEELGEDTE